MRLPPTATSTDTPFPYTTLFRSAIAHRIERNGEFLGAAVIFVPAGLMADFWATLDLGPNSSVGLLRDDGWLIARHPVPDDTMNLGDRSEEHTSELQSLMRISYAVFCLKKKRTTLTHNQHHN